MGPRAGPVFGNEGIRGPCMEVRTWTLGSYGLWKMREKLERGGQEGKGVPALHVVEKEAHQGDHEVEEMA